VSNLGGRLLRAIIIIYAARVLGATQWGIFSYAISLVAFITVFTDIGISPVLVRETAKSREDPQAQQQILSTSSFIKIILLAFGVLTIIFVTPRISTIQGVNSILYIVTFIFAFDTIREFGFSLIRAIEKMELEAFLYLLTNLAIVIFGFIFLYLSRTVQSFAYSYAIGTGIGMAATVFVLREKFRGIFSNFSLRILKLILSSAWPFAISAFLGVLMINTDILIIGWLRSAEDVGLYSAAQRIVQLLYLLPSILGTSLLPAFARLANRDNEKLRRIFEKVLSFTFLMAIPIAIGGFVLGKEIISFVFGSGYLKASSSFQILIVTILIDFPVVILGNLVFAYNKQKNLTLYAAIGGVANVIFDLILIPIFGIVGSAFATLFAQFLSNIYLRWIAKKINYFRVLPYLKNVLLATAVMTALTIGLRALAVHVVAIIGAAAMVYFGLLLLLKEPLFKEIKLILQPVSSAAPETDEPNS
jgi:O-antigen/teichoic acid export membrane protein